MEPNSSRHGEHASPNDTPQGPHALSGQPTGWAAMAARMREYDEDRVKDIKEDIDGLFIFSGLFSAVLTAFVVESYQRLSPDTSSQMLVMMQQMSLQMSSFNTPIGMINSTYQPLLPTPVAGLGEQPFQPSSIDIRVNVLWFASLIFSLVTASFGILIKQWLREYLAVTNPSPQARLRIRHFRYPELEQWKVIEIAGVLPLLQQLSLALFFIGLCYFTESVHSSIGRTSLPLVAGWAFCFATVTILPLFFPRCPYKTTLLKRLLISTHLWLARSLKQLLWWLYVNSTGKLETAFDILYVLLIKDIYKSDERIILADEDADLAILAEVDSVQLNDELLATAIFESLQQIHNPSYKNVVNFILRVLGHRLSRNDLVSSDPAPIGLWSLSRRGYNAIIDILINFIKAQDLNTLLEAREGIYAFHILFSESRFPLPQSGRKLLKTMFGDARTRRKLAEKLVESCATDYKVGERSSNYLCLLEGIPNVLNSLDVELEVSLEFFEDAFDVWFRRVSDCPLPRFTITGNLNGWSWDTTRERQVMDSLSTIIIQTLGRDSAQVQAPLEPTVVGYTGSQAPIGKSSGGKISDALYGMYNMAAEVYYEPYALQRTVISCQKTKEHTLALLDAVRRIETPTFIRCYDRNHKILSNLEDVPSKGIESLVEGLGQLRQVEPDYALRLLCLGIHLVTSPTARQYTDQWHTLFKVLMDSTYESLSAAYSSTVADSRREFSIDVMVYYIVKLAQSQNISAADFSSAAARCLTSIQTFDSWECSSKYGWSTEEQRSRWWSEFTAEDYAYPDELVEMLAAIYFASSGDDADDSKWWRVQKLRVKENVRDTIIAARADDTRAIPLLAPGTPSAIDVSGISDNPSNVTLAAAIDVAGAPHAQPCITPTGKFTDQVLTPPTGVADPDVSDESSTAKERRKRILEAALKRQKEEKGRGLRKYRVKHWYIVSTTGTILSGYL